MLAGLVLVALANQWWFLAIGASSVFAAWGYTGGKHPYGYMGLGDVFVFVYFGLVAIGIGLISCALLMANNVRDIPTDIEAGKLTLAVRLGERWSRVAYIAEMALALLLTVLLIDQNPWFMLVFVLVGPTVHSCMTVWMRGGRELIPVLKQAGIVALVYSVLLALAVWLGSLDIISHEIQVFTGY